MALTTAAGRVEGQTLELQQQQQEMDLWQQQQQLRKQPQPQEMGRWQPEPEPRKEQQQMGGWQQFETFDSLGDSQWKAQVCWPFASCLCAFQVFFLFS